MAYSAALLDFKKGKKKVKIHEAGIAANIIAIVNDIAHQNGLEIIHSVEIDIGAFSGVQIDALNFALSALTPQTNLQNTEFIINAIPIVLFCQICKNKYVADIDDLVCPGCNCADFLVMNGKEMIVKSIAGEKPADE